MKPVLYTWILILGCLLVAPARADVVVLVHGYLNGARTWDESGITAVMEHHNWQRAGVYIAGPAGVQLVPAPGNGAQRKYYTVDLPSEAPILVQAFQLRQILDAISLTHQGEPITLVGHSAGGVIARAALVRHNSDNIRALITIASPHLGTERAEQALDATDIPFPLSVITDFFGGATYHTAMRSRSLFVDLVRPRPGNLLFWLNSMPHPDIEYFSIIRGQAATLSGDYIVPGHSQDMNNVPALRGKSSAVPVNTDHSLHALDGSVIVGLLADLD
ncbi:MAG: alpha/beta fold hydrolase [Gammaproteobacteria bacterium]